MLTMHSYGATKIEVIKALRNTVQAKGGRLPLQEAKKIVEAVPVRLDEELPIVRGNEEDFFDALLKCGAVLDMTSVDLEIEGLSSIAQVMGRLNSEAQDRIARWVFDRYAK